MKNVLVIGSTTLTRAVLEYLVKSDVYKVAGILTNSRTFKISYSVDPVENSKYADLESISRRQKIPFYRMKQDMRETGLQKWMASLSFDFALIVGWFHMIPSLWLRQYICIGVHASLLPEYRGGAPLIWAIMNGERETGVSLFQLDDEVDAGPIILQKQFRILDTDYITDVLQKAELCTLELIDEFLSQGAQIVPTCNLKRTAGKIYPQRSPKDGLLNTSSSALEAYNFIRSQSRPYPGAFLEIDGLILRIWRSELPSDCEYTEPYGFLEFHNKQLRMYFGYESLLFTEVEYSDNIRFNQGIKDFVKLWNTSRVL